MKTRLLLFLLVATSFVKAQTVSTFAGSGVPGYVDATGVAAQFGLGGCLLRCGESTALARAQPKNARPRGLRARAQPAPA